MDSEGKTGRENRDSATASLQAEADAQDERDKRIAKGARRMLALFMRPYGKAVQYGGRRK